MRISYAQYKRLIRLRSRAGHYMDRLDTMAAEVSRIVGGGVRGEYAGDCIFGLDSVDQALERLAITVEPKKKPGRPRKLHAPTEK